VELNQEIIMSIHFSTEMGITTDVLILKGITLAVKRVEFVTNKLSLV
jgi:hypothetical protein